MNQKKNLTYVLLAVTLGIWGVIGYRIVSGLQAPEIDQVNQDSKGLAKIPVTELSDSVELFLNYPDPFLKGKSKEKVTSHNKVKNTSRAIRESIGTSGIATKEVYWPLIEYNGVIENKANNTRVVMLKVNNEDFLLKEKQTGQNVQLLKVHKDSILVSYNKQSRYIQRKVN